MVDLEKDELLHAVKRESKKLMEEAVTRKFVHTDSSCVTSLCAMVECCLLHKLKKRGGILPPTSSSDTILSKLAKYCDTAEFVAKLIDSNNRNQRERFFLTDPVNSSNNKWTESRHNNGYSSGASFNNTKYLWIRIALLEKVLTTIVGSLVKHWSDFYEQDALLADKVLGPSLVWLLDGPCSVDFSKMKTPDCLYADPSSYELVQRHHIYCAPMLSHAISIHSPRRRRLFSVTALPGKGETELIPAPLMAREHVESLHQNPVSQCLYGKNHVELLPVDFNSPVPGYLSLHKSSANLLLKWTPNPMLQSKDIPHTTGEKCEFWGQVITIDMTDVVYIHCHDSGNSGGMIVLVTQDGVQLQPLTFPPGSLYTFLSCLEQGLSPEGQLDPPLFSNSGKFFQWPRFKNKMLLIDGIGNRNGIAEIGTHDLVFQITNKVSSHAMDKNDLKKLLLMNLSPLSKKSGAVSKRAEPTSPQTQANNIGLGQHVNVMTPHLALSMACQKMKHQILSRAFNGWVSSYRHLKTVRTHLISLVLPWSYNLKLPEDVDSGLTKQKWETMASNLKEHSLQVRQYVYYGGIEESLRIYVWPYLLGHFTFEMSNEEICSKRSEAVQKYSTILEECKCLEQILQEKEKDILSLNGFSNGETFGNIEIDDDSYMNDTSDIVSRDLSTCSNISEPVTEIGIEDEDENRDRSTFSFISSLIETRENLKEVIEKASAHGASVWEKLSRKKKKSKHSTILEHPLDIAMVNEKFDGLEQKFVPSSEQFDANFNCQTCAAASDESAYDLSNVIDSDCFNYQNSEDISPFMVAGSPSTAMYSESLAESDDLQVRSTSTPVLDSRYSEDEMKEFAINIHRIDKDVLRCDRNHPYFESDVNLEKLRNIVMCYVLETLSIGYIQGMCDLCAPLLIVMDDEAEVYACFKKFMEKMTNNFPHGNAMDLHLSNIGSLIQILDPELHEILEGHGDGTIFYFCYRWFLLDFKRELQYEDIYLVWETIWASKTWISDHFNLFVALAMIELYRGIIIDNKMDFTDIIKFFNEMAEQHDAQATLNLARNIVKKLQDIMYPSSPYNNNSDNGSVHKSNVGV